MIRKATKRLIRSLILTVVILILAVIFGGPPLIKRVIGVDTIVSWVSGDLSRQLNRQLLIRDVSFGFLTGMKLKEVQISEPPTFKEGTFIKAKHFVLKPSFGDLLMGRVNITEMHLEGAVIQISRNSSGTWNMADIFAKPSDAPQSLVLRAPEDEAAKPAAFSLDVEDVRISESHFSLRDALGKIPEFNAHDIEVRLSNFSLQAPFKTSIEFTLIPSSSVAPSIRQWLDPPLQVKLKGKSHLTDGNWKQMNFSLDRLYVQSQSWVMESTASVRSLGPLTGKISAHLDFKNFHVPVSTRALTFSGPADVNLRLKLSNGAPDTGALSIHQAAAETGSNYELKLAAKDLEVSLGNAFRKPKGVPFELQANGGFGVPPQEKAANPDVKEIHGDMALHLSSAPARIGNWRIRWPRRSVAEAVKAGEALLDVQTSSANFPTPPLYAFFPVVQDWSARDGTLHWRELNLRRWRGRWVLSGRGLHLKQVGVVKRKQKIGFMEAVMDSAQMRGKGGVFESDFNSLIEVRAADTRFLACRELVTVADMKGVGNSRNPKINGEIHAHFEEGALKEVSNLVEYAAFVQFLLKPLRIIEDLDYWGILKLDDVDFNSVEMDSMHADYYFSNTKMSLEKLSMRGPVGRVEVRGAINFPAKEINMVSTVNVPKGKTPFAMASAFSDALGNPLFSIKIKGPLDKPGVYTIPANKKDMLASDLDDQFKAFRHKIKDVWGKIFH